LSLRAALPAALLAAPILAGCGRSVDADEFENQVPARPQET
jgi:hypothetical protein